MQKVVYSIEVSTTTQLFVVLGYLTQGIFDKYKNKTISQH